MGVGNVIINAGMKILIFGFYYALYQYRLFEISPLWWSWVLLFVAEDFCYYWYHRGHHEIRFLWAAHVNHHSSTHYNLSTALRQPWTTVFTGFIFWAPLPLIGFPIEMIVVMQAISLLYQYWLHTEVIDRLGWFESIFNTPSHHRVHHGRNPQYLDRNHAGILIIWDRLFGTFEPEDEPVDYGLTKNIETYNLLKVAFHEWQAMFKDIFVVEGWKAKLGYFLQPPGWRHDGSGKTSHELRLEWESAKSH